MTDSAQMDKKIGRKAIDSKNASVKGIYWNVVDYKINLKHCVACLKRLRTANESIMPNSDKNCF